MDNDISISTYNHFYMQKDLKIRELINELKNIEIFLSELSELILGRDIILCKNYVFSPKTILTSTELTIGSITECCNCACFGDANILLRKYRDDLFFYLYIMIYEDSRKLAQNKIINEMEENICRWIENGLSNLYIQDVLKTIGNSPKLKGAIIKYHLQQSFNKIGERLNNFVHGNGIAFYNRNIISYKRDELYNYLKALTNDMKYITITFLFLLILCTPYLVQSTDYIDFLDIGVTPDEETKYWVAPFVEEFIYNNIHLIDKNCYKYLKENTYMKFEKTK